MLLAVLIPLLSMLCNITADGFNEIIHSNQFVSAVINSLTSTLVATVITMFFAFFAAWCTERISIKIKAVFAVIFVLPMLVPSISHAFGLIALFGANGMITQFLGLNGSIYGFWGIVIGSLMYSFPVAYLMFASILHYEDALPYRAALVLGINKWHSFLGITLPYLRKSIVMIFFAIFTMIITDYGVPLTVGGKVITLSVLMYNKAVGMIDYSSGSVIGAVLLLPAILAFLADMFSKENGQNAFVTETIIPDTHGWINWLAHIYCVGVVICVLAPIVSFLLMVFATKYPINMDFTLYHLEMAVSRGALSYLVNSLIYALLAASAGTIGAFGCAYMTTRMQGHFGKCLHLMILTSMAIPGIVLGLSYVICFSGSWLYGTVFIIVFVNMVHFFASPYLMMYNTMQKLNPNLEAVGLTLGIGKLRIIKDVIVPKVSGTMFEMFLYFFVNSMMTISAVSFLAPPSPKPVALLINQFEAQMLMESAAFVSLLILSMNLVIKVVVSYFKERVMV